MICIIPARGGSKRLPQKNILDFRGRPLLAHVIETAYLSKIFEHVIVTSECDRILEIAKREGATCFKRSNELATDTTPVTKVCLDVLNSYEATSFCCIYPTSVLLHHQTLTEAYNLFNSYTVDQCSVLMGVSEFNYHPVQALTEADDGTWKMLFPNYKSKRSQEYPRCKVSNGTFYIARVASFNEEKNFYSNKLKVFDVPSTQVSDIDTAEEYHALLKTHSN